MVTQGSDGAVVFRFFRPEARQVYLAGDFNGWQKTCMPLAKGEDGWWSYRIGLAPGIYQFRYIADGQWYTDYAAFGLEHGPFGWNSVLKVEAPRVKPVATVKPSIRPERTRSAEVEDDVLSHALDDNHSRQSERQRPVRVPAMAE